MDQNTIQTKVLLHFCGNIVYKSHDFNIGNMTQMNRVWGVNFTISCVGPEPCELNGTSPSSRGPEARHTRSRWRCRLRRGGERREELLRLWRARGSSQQPPHQLSGLCSDACNTCNTCRKLAELNTQWTGEQIWSRGNENNFRLILLRRILRT